MKINKILTGASRRRRLQPQVSLFTKHKQLYTSINGIVEQCSLDKVVLFAWMQTFRYGNPSLLTTENKAWVFQGRAKQGRHSTRDDLWVGNYHTLPNNEQRDYKVHSKIDSNNNPTHRSDLLLLFVCVIVAGSFCSRLTFLFFCARPFYSTLARLRGAGRSSGFYVVSHIVTLKHRHDLRINVYPIQLS